MTQLKAVEEARAVFAQSKDWGVVRWLAEKRRVRQLADGATAAIDSSELEVKSRWPEVLKDAYAGLGSAAGGAQDDDDPYAAAEREFASLNAAEIPEHVTALARRVKDADDAAYGMRMTAEETFKEAERRLSIALSKRGAEEAIKSYDLYYTAIEEAEAAGAACQE
jgi:hypothetical protein